MPRGQWAWAEKAAEKLAPSPYVKDPVGWAANRVNVELWSKQREIMRALIDNRRVAVRSAHATGKSFTAATTSAWWLDVHPPGEAMVVSTAPSREQVHSILWEEIRKLHREHNLIGEVQRSDRWLLSDGTLIGMGRKPPDHQQSAFQGIHRKYVLVIMDEAGGIPSWMWHAVKTITTGPECRVLAIGNPDDSSSEFARIFSNDTTWYKTKISAFDSPNFTDEDVSDEVKQHLVSREWVSDVKQSWGEHNPLYIAKVLGEFADSDDGLIPLSWVTQANNRWRLWNELSARRKKEIPGQTIFGVDVGHLGTDKTVIATRKGHVIMNIESWVKRDTVEVTNLVEARLRQWVNPVAIVDGIGIGAGVVDMLRSHGFPVRSFIASGSTRRRDDTGMLKFANLRSAAWWNLREHLDPSKDPTLAIPPNDQLTADITAPRWQDVSGGRVQVEPKESIRRRIGRSTDFGDAVVQAVWGEHVDREWGGGHAKPKVHSYNVRDEFEKLAAQF